MTDGEINDILMRQGDYLIQKITGKWQCMFKSHTSGRIVLTTDSVISPARAKFNCQCAVYNQLFLICNAVK